MITSCVFRDQTSSNRASTLHLSFFCNTRFAAVDSVELFSIASMFLLYSFELGWVGNERRFSQQEAIHLILPRTHPTQISPLRGFTCRIPVLGVLIYSMHLHHITTSFQSQERIPEENVIKAIHQFAAHTITCQEITISYHKSFADLQYKEPLTKKAHARSLPRT